MTRASEESLAGLRMLSALAAECAEEVALQTTLIERIPGARKTLDIRNAERIARLAVAVDALATTVVENLEGSVDDG